MGLQSLATSRVLVVDDEPEEANALLKVLWEQGVGLVYVKGDKQEELPREPIEGVRLVFLDLRLGEGGDVKGALSKTAGVLTRCIGSAPMPIFIVCWTKHAEDIDAFRDIVSERMPSLDHGLIVPMAKPTKGSPQEWKNLLQDIRSTLKSHTALSLLWQWESTLHVAAISTSQALETISGSLAKRSIGTPGTWQESMLAVCGELVRAEAGQEVNRKTASNALFRTMGELASDTIRQAVLQRPLDCADLLIPPVKPALDLDHASKLNQMLLTETVEEEDTSCSPGTVYISRGADFPKKMRTVLGLNKQGLADLLLAPDAHDDWKKLSKEEASKREQAKTQVSLSVRKRLKELQAAKKKLLTDIAFACRPLLIEISPSCDFAQGKRPVAHFLAGLAVPQSLAKCIKKPEGFIYGLDPTTLPSLSGIWTLLLSSRHIFALANPSQKVLEKPICRMRAHALTDLRMWAAHQNARPGMLSIRPARPK